MAKQLFRSEQEMLDFASENGLSMQSYSGANGITFTAQNGRQDWRAWRTVGGWWELKREAA